MKEQDTVFTMSMFKFGENKASESPILKKAKGHRRWGPYQAEGRTGKESGCSGIPEDFSGYDFPEFSHLAL